MQIMFLSDLQGPLALEALSQQQGARLGQWGDAAAPFHQSSVAFPLPQQLAHLAQPGMARFPHQLLRAANWGLNANMEDEAIASASTGPPFPRFVCVHFHLLLVFYPDASDMSQLWKIEY